MDRSREILSKFLKSGNLISITSRTLVEKYEAAVRLATSSFRHQSEDRFSGLFTTSEFMKESMLYPVVI